MAIDFVSPEERYNREKLKRSINYRTSLEQLAVQVKENIRDHQLLMSAGELLREEPHFYLRMHNEGQWTGDLALNSDLRIAREVCGNILREYAENNLRDILQDFEKEKLEALVRALPLLPENVLRLPFSHFQNMIKIYSYKTESEEYNEIRDVLNNFALVQGILVRGEESEFDDYIMKRLEKLESSKKLHERFLFEFYSAGKTIPGYSEQTMKAYAKQAEMDVRRVLNTTKEKFLGFLLEAYEKAENTVKRNYLEKVLNLVS